MSPDELRFRIDQRAADIMACIGVLAAMTSGCMIVAAVYLACATQIVAGPLLALGFTGASIGFGAAVCFSAAAATRRGASYFVRAQLDAEEASDDR